MAALLLFFVSGAASLILETVFRRELALLVGNAVTATSLTLAIFLGGLAIGAVVFGREADRSRNPLRLYGMLELAAGLTSALAVAVLTYARDALFAPAAAVGAGPMRLVIEAVVASALLLPPTICMGGTLPALTRHLTREGGLLGSLARLYAVNTLGAATGAALAGFVLFEAVGVSATGWIGVGAALVAGGVAVVLARPAAVTPLPVRRGTVASRVASPRIAVTCAALGGAAALGYEVVWTRLLALPLRSYSYSFSLMLALFLIGLVLGSALLATLAPRLGDPLAALAWTQSISGAWVAVSVLWLPALLAPSQEGSGFGAFVLAGVTRAAPLVLPPTILSGMALPLAVRVFAASADRAGRDVGVVYAANTLGAIAGALVTALALMPMLGASGTLAVLGALAASSGAIARAPGARRAMFAAVAAACLALAFVPSGAVSRAFSKAGRSQEAGHVLFYREGATDTVAVVRRNYGFQDAEAKSELVNGIAMTATVKPVWRYMAAEGHLPALMAPERSKALVVCVGTGITLGAVASHVRIPSIDAVDLSEGILAALPVFARENGEVLKDPRVRFVRDDGRHFLALSDSSYGLITLEPPPPIVAGSVHLYTLDFYRLCRRRLQPGGVVAQWLPLHAQSLASARATARTFLEAFPHVQLWLPSIRDAVLLGSDRPFELDAARLDDAYANPRTRASLEAAYLESPEALLGTFLFDRAALVRWSAGADRITDDRPWMEFFHRYGRTMGDREIAGLLEPPPAAYSWLKGGSPALLDAVDVERRAHLAYIASEVSDDPRQKRAAAIAPRGTHFGRYRVGCDTPQLEALRAETAGGARYGSQSEMCSSLFGP
jgi:spermidine synthase